MRLPRFLTRKTQELSVEPRLLTPSAKKHFIQQIDDLANHLNTLSNGCFSSADSDFIISPRQATSLYKRVAPMAISVDLINDEFENIPPLIINPDGSFQKDHAILDLLDNPDGDLTTQEFQRRIGSYYKITGEVYLLALGDINRPPVGIQVIDPRNVIINEEFRGSHPRSIQIIDKQNLNLAFKPELKAGQIRFIDAAGQREIWSIRNFNPDNQNRGMPVVQGVLAEIEQYINSSSHNLSLLKNGGRPFHYLILNELFSGDRAQLTEQAAEFFDNIASRGKISIPPEGTDIKETGITNRDMDFVELKKNVTVFIYNKYRVPLPLVMPDKQTRANVEHSIPMLYDNAVIPLANRIFAELTKFIVPRFTNDKIKISFDIREIPALRGRTLIEQTAIHGLQAVSTNETRNALGFEDAEGADSILVPSNLIPLTSAGEPKEEEKAIMDRRRQIMILTAQKDVKGNRLFNDQEIDKIIG